MMKARVIPSQPEIAVLYHFKETQQEGAVLRELLSQHHIEACSLPEEALGQTVASFLAGEPPVAGKQAPYPGQVIVFSGVAAQKQQAVLRALRDARVGGGDQGSGYADKPWLGVGTAVCRAECRACAHDGAENSRKRGEL